MSAIRLWVCARATRLRLSQRLRRTTSSGSTPGRGRATRSTPTPTARNSSASGPSGGGASDTAVTRKPARTCEAARSSATRSCPPIANDDSTWATCVMAGSKLIAPRRVIGRAASANDLVDDEPRLAGGRARDRIHVADLDLGVATQMLAEDAVDLGLFRGRGVAGEAHDVDGDVAHPPLDDLELLHPLDHLERVRPDRARDRIAAGLVQDVVHPPVDANDPPERAPAGASRRGQGPCVAVLVPNHGHGVVVEIGDQERAFPEEARAFRRLHFDHRVLVAGMVDVGDVGAGVAERLNLAAPVVREHLGAESPGDGVAPVVEQRLGGGEDGVESEADAAPLGVAGEEVHRRGVTDEEPRAGGADGVEVCRGVLRAELERGEETFAGKPALGAIEPTETADTEGPAEELDERIAEAQPAPAEPSPVATALPDRTGFVADDLDRVSGGAAGRAELDGSGTAQAERVGLLAENVFGQDGELGQVGEPPDVRRADAVPVHHLPVVGAALVGRLDQPNELFVAEPVDARPLPSLALLQEVEGLGEAEPGRPRARLPVETVD